MAETTVSTLAHAIKSGIPKLASATKLMESREQPRPLLQQK